MSETPAAAQIRRAGPVAALLAALIAALIACCAAPAALAVAPLSFSSPEQIDTELPLKGVSCVSEALCVAVDAKGGALVSSDPSSPSAAWARADIDGAHALSSVSCVPEGLCVAVDEAGAALISSDAGAQWRRVKVDEHEHALTAVSCASLSLCAAVDASGDVLISTDPASDSAPWVEVEHAEGLRSVSCTEALCLAAGSSTALVSEEPARARTWVSRAVDPALSLDGVSCTASVGCVAVDEGADALASADPEAQGPTWSSTPLALAGRLSAVSCAASGLCLAVGADGQALASDDPTAITPAWSGYTPDAGAALSAVDCLQGGLCLAVDEHGHALSARVPAPQVITSGAVAVSSSSATLTGTVDPQDAALQSCFFEYGASTSYGQRAQCAGTPAPSGGAQAVSATITGLAANSAYHYRLLAASPAGAADGGEESFATPTSSAIAVLHPHPSISGAPAVDEKLTCHSGLTGEPQAQLSYQWLRNLVVIPNATSATYSVRGADNGAHLQCQLTATDGGGSATATSAFVDVPVQSPPTAGGETSVAAASAHGALIALPVTCAAYAPEGCRIALRASAVEPLRGRRVIPSARGAAGGGHTPRYAGGTVALASATKGPPAGKAKRWNCPSQPQRSACCPRAARCPRCSKSAAPSSA